MTPKTITTLLLSSFLYSTSLAFVPLNIHPPIDNNNLPPPTPNAAQWIPIATLSPLAATPTPTPSPSQPLDSYDHDLKARQVTGQAAGAAAPTAPGQISPITTYFVNSEIAPGSFAQVPVVYTQTFDAVPDQWPGAAAGSVGLGTIQGTVGAVRTKDKRSQPTQMPLAEGGREEEEEEVQIFEIHAEIIPPERMEAMRPKLASLVESDARRAFQAGTLAVLAVSVGTLCVSYL